MEYGFAVPTDGPLAEPDQIVTLARRGEELGFEFMSVSDHVLIPKNIVSRYPYGETGEWADGDYCLEQLTALSFVASQTSTARLLTSVMVLPYRSPVLAAKMLSSIDVLSCGRVIVGCGVGWMREEFEALGSPPYDERGAVGDEYIRAFKELWTSDNPSFEGKYCSFSDITFLPKPVQKPHPPIWIGGESPPALRRAARYGDAWYPIGDNPRHPAETPDQLAEFLPRLHRYAEEAGRDPAQIGLAYCAGYSADAYDDEGETALPTGQRRQFTGSAERIAGDIRAFERVGVKYMQFFFQTDSLSQTLERMERFARDVRPLAED